MTLLNDDYYDACYEAWRRGEDPDAVDPYDVRDAVGSFDGPSQVVDDMVRRRRAREEQSRG